jgi:uncharacterized protein (TIGR02302 family)
VDGINSEARLMAMKRLGMKANTLPGRLARKRATARAVILAEHLWLLVLPLVGVAALFVSLSWLGYFRAVPDWVRLASLCVMGLGLLLALVPWRHFRLPGRSEVDRRLEADNGIAHQAIATQDDRLETDDPLARALWQEHRRRMAERFAALQVGMPRPDTPRRDPFGVRAFVVLLLVTAFAFSYSNQSGRLGDAFVSHAAGIERPVARIDAWVTPPDYTRRAPIFLTAGDTALPPVIDIPQGSSIVVRIAGSAGDEAVTYQPDGDSEAAPVPAVESALPPPAQPEAETVTAAAPTASSGATSFELVAEESGTLAIAATDANQWSFRVVPDLQPEIEFGRPPQGSVNGTLELAYIARDDHGVTAARVEIEPAAPQPATARPLYDAPDFALTLPRQSPRVHEGRASQDLTAHPLAGLPVSVTLVAEDAIGQLGRSAPVDMLLPARSFTNPLAAALVEQRRILALDANARPEVLRLMDAMTIVPEETFENLSHYLLVVSARSRVAQAYDEDGLRAAADNLWDIALGIEDGNLSVAEQRLRDAQRELAEALENDASDEEIQALMEELRQAMQEYLQALAEEMQNSDTAQQFPQGEMENLLRQQDIDAMLDQIENLARQGARDQAQEMLAELQRMMNNLQTGRQQQQQQRGDSAMQQQMDQLGELMREQQQLMNETFELDKALNERMMRDQPPITGFPEFDMPQRQPGQDGEQAEGDQNGQQDMTAEELREALRQLRERQEGLQEQLSQLQDELEGLGIEPGEGFGEAGEAMGDASGALGEGEGERAVGDQGRALQALRQGAQDMMQQMQQQMGQGQGEGPGMMPRPGGQANRDPLGRPQSNSGPDFGDSVRVPDEIDIQRAREILEAIRDRLGNALSPELERRYLERLLDIR